MKAFCAFCGTEFTISRNRIYTARIRGINPAENAYCSRKCIANKNSYDKHGCDTLAERFWKKVAKATDGCWEWSGSRNKAGYGSFGMGTTSVVAHRMAWELTNGKIPDGLDVLHRCDNPPCCNPDHLWLGTDLDNNRDMIAKNRHNHSGLSIGRIPRKNLELVC